MNKIRNTVIACALLLSAVFASSVQAAVCPYTYLFELNGQHYYAACKCKPPNCLERPIDQILIYNQQVQHTGCDRATKKGLDTCVCETSLMPVGSIIARANLTDQLGERIAARITKDDFVVTQYQGYSHYFRTLTFSATNSKSGEAEERSIAIPLAQKTVTELVTGGINGQTVVFHETAFDGAKVTFAGKTFHSIVRNNRVKPLLQVGQISK